MDTLLRDLSLVKACSLHLVPLQSAMKLGSQSARKVFST